VLGGLFTGTLNALRLFWFAALQPVVFQLLGIIAFGIVLPQFGMGIESQAGARCGALIGFDLYSDSRRAAQWIVARAAMGLA
jgi:hypothetical protein